MAVRSRRLSAVVVLPTGAAVTPVFTCPADRTAVVRGCFICNSTGVVNSVTLFNPVGFYVARFANNQLQIDVDREFMVNPGDTLSAAGIITATVVIHGSLLLGAPS